MENKIKVFEDREVRTVWNADEEEWYFSVVDVVAVLTDSKDPSAQQRSECILAKVEATLKVGRQ